MPYSVPEIVMRNVGGDYRSWPANPTSFQAATGSFITSGQDTSLKVGRRLIADAVSYVLSGQTSTLFKTPSAPVLSTPTMTSDGAVINFSGGGFATLVPQYSTNQSTWTSLSSDITSPLTFTGLEVGTYYFRALANGLEAYASNVVSGVISGGLPFPLPAGHFIPAKGAMDIVYPRPDTETPTWAKHRKAYYDGTNPIQYRVPVGVRLGAAPYHFTLLSGPDGMSIGTYWGDTDYGVVRWTPIGSETNRTVTVRVTDQELNSIDVTWTVTTSSSTSDFIFVKTTGNDTTGTGSYSAPFATLSKVLGTTAAQSTYPQRTAYFDTGSYTVPSHSGGSAVLNSSNKPSAYVAIPNADVSFNITTAGFSGSGSSINDFILEDIALNTSAATAGVRTLIIDATNVRVTFNGVDFVQPNASNGLSNFTGILLASYTSGAPGREYYYIRGCTEDGRPSQHGSGITCAFVLRKSLLEFNRITNNNSSQSALTLKASCEDITVRYNYCHSIGGSFGLGTICQVDAGITTKNIETCYNTIDYLTGGVSALHFNFINGNTATAHWAYRNTIRGKAEVRVGLTPPGPFISENNVVVVSSGTAVAGFTTNTGTECQGTTANGIIDSSLLLTGTYRTNYLGLRGAEIA